MSTQRKPALLAVLGGVLLNVPGIIFLGAAAARGVTGPPIRALLSPIVDTAAHAPRWVFLVCLLAMPAGAVCVAGAALLHVWTVDPSLHEDARGALHLIRRRLLELLLLGTTIAGGLILAIVVGHMLTD